MSIVISSQTGGSGAPEITDDQPCSGGPSRELHNIIGEVSAALEIAADNRSSVRDRLNLLVRDTVVLDARMS